MITTLTTPNDLEDIWLPMEKYGTCEFKTPNARRNSSNNLYGMYIQITKWM